MHPDEEEIDKILDEHFKKEAEKEWKLYAPGEGVSKKLPPIPDECKCDMKKGCSCEFGQAELKRERDAKSI